MKEKISGDQVRGVITMSDVLVVCHHALLALANGQAKNPPRKQSITEDGFHLEMSAEIRVADGRLLASGKKVIDERNASDAERGRALGVREAAVVLDNPATGQPAFTVDAETITNWRTGAVAALAAGYLTSGPVSRVAIVGTGRTAESIAMGVDEQLRPDLISATSRTSERCRAFIDDITPLVHAELKADQSDIGVLTQSADVVFAAVPSPTPIILHEHLGGVRHLGVIAGDPRTRQVSHEVMRDALVIPDHYEQAQESGEFIHAIDIGELEHFGLHSNDDGAVFTVADAAAERIPQSGEMTLAYFTGLGLFDVALGALVVNRTVGGFDDVVTLMGLH
jgi:ornithine cyclodeaminase/alanine dehydrogenase-like protein (mu-crystallin family)